MKRTLRPRPAGQYISQQEWQLGSQDEDDLILGRRYNVLEKFHSQDYQIDHGFVIEMDGKDFDLKHVQEKGLAQPIVFRSSDGLGMRMPSRELTVVDIKKLVGSRRKVDVMDALTQDSSSMSLGQWSKYFETRPRRRILNIISLEFSCTKLDPLVEAPQMVRELDWVEQVWPQELKNMQTNPTNDLNKMMYPKVQKYCLMSVSGCYTDFHIDFGGTSVWYHVLKGEKQFLLIPPSSENYSLFQHWQMSGEQEGVFLAEVIGKAQLVHLHAGDTFIMPSGWIHAVYTPSDSIVFGGNFLHSFNIAQQLMVADLEQNTKVPLRLKYPFYGTIHWYVLINYAKELKRLTTTGSKESATGDSKEKSPSINRRWLKEVSVERLTVDDTVMPLCNPTQGTTEGSKEEYHTKTIAMTPISSQPDPEQKQEVTDGLSDRSSSLKATPKPHLSSHERGGLLLLVHKMKNNLFSLELPSSLSSPHDLITELESLLQSALPSAFCSMEPSGVGVLLSGRQSLTSQTEIKPHRRKARKREADTLVNTSNKKINRHITGRKQNPSTSTTLSVSTSSQSHISVSQTGILLDSPQIELSCSLDDKQATANTSSSTAHQEDNTLAGTEATLLLPSEQPTLPPSSGPSSLFILLSPGLPPSLITACTSNTTHRNEGSRVLLTPLSGQVLSATSPVCLAQEFEEVTVTQVLNPAFSTL